MRVPKKVAERISRSLGLFQRVLADAKKRDVNESDTVTIVTDLLADVFGYSKYTEITSEQAIRGTYCDLAVRENGQIKFLIEVKAVGLTLRENHLRQAVSYGANQGIPWIVLTNGVAWEIYKLKFEQPISYDQVCAFDILELAPRKATDQETLFLLCKEGLAKAAIESFHHRVQVVNRFVVAAVIQSEPVLSVVRRELKRLSPDTRVTVEEIAELLPDVLKRDVVEGDTAAAAKRQVSRAATKLLRKTKEREASEPSGGPTGKSDTAGVQIVGP